MQKLNDAAQSIYFGKKWLKKIVPTISHNKRLDIIMYVVYAGLEMK